MTFSLQFYLGGAFFTFEEIVGEIKETSTIGKHKEV